MGSTGGPIGPPVLPIGPLVLPIGPPILLIGHAHVHAACTLDPGP